MRLMVLAVLLTLLVPAASATALAGDEGSTEDPGCINQNGTKVSLHYNHCTKTVREVLEIVQDAVKNSAD